MEVKIENKGGIEVMTVTLPITKRTSASGKTLIVASSNGSTQTAANIDGKPVTISFNAWIKK